MGGQGGESACERWTLPMRRQESMQATPRHDTKRPLISVHIYIHTHDMRHTRCTDISINTVDVDSLSDGGRNGSNKVRVYDI